MGRKFSAVLRFETEGDAKTAAPLIRKATVRKKKGREMSISSRAAMLSTARTSCTLVKVAAFVEFFHGASDAGGHRFHGIFRRRSNYGRIVRQLLHGLGSNLGDAPGSLESYRKAVAIAERLLRENPKSALVQRLWARSQQGLGEVLAHSGEPRKAVESFQKAIPVFESLAGAEPENTSAQLD